MGTQIIVEINFGNGSVQRDDINRAENAALAVLANRDPSKVYAEYQRQWEYLDGEEGMTGDALVWIAAQQAADVALTSGWYNPNGASCSLAA